MCQITGEDAPKQALDNQVYEAPNRYGFIAGEDEGRSVHLSVDMVLIRCGARQYLRNDKRHPPLNKWPSTKKDIKEDYQELEFSCRRYPNVDIYKCSKCGAEIIFEGDSKKIFP